MSNPSGTSAYVRRETFLARYPRDWKLAITFGILVLLIAPWFLIKWPYEPPRVQQQVPMAVNKAPEKPLAPDNAMLGIEAAPGTSAEREAIAANDTDDRAARMTHAPDPGLTEITNVGELPKTGEDGRQPWQVYSRPFNTLDRRPRVAIVVTDLGLSRVASDATLHRLPAAVTLAFDVQSPVVGAWLSRARQDGHETLLALPMEPFDYPRSDPGPRSLLTNLPNTDNLQRLTWALLQGAGYVGVTTVSGSRFTTDTTKIMPILETMKQRGLLVFDARVAPHSVIKETAKQLRVPVAAGTQQIDGNPSPEAIDTALNQLEQTARLSGRAIGIASPLPVTLDHLEAWIKQLPSHGIALAPLSAMVE